jgi:hypothetical protein
MTNFQKAKKTDAETSFSMTARVFYTFQSGKNK